MPTSSSAILFDMDGTLVQTRESSWELFRETNAKFGLGIDDRDAFFELFQENFFRSLAKRCPDPAKLAEVKAHFLDLLRTRYRPELIPGMADVVRSLAPHFALAVLSTNTMATIRRLLTEAGLAHCFAHVFAGDVEPDKSVSIRRFLADRNYGYGRSCSPAYREGEAAAQPTPDSVVLVTDTAGDVKEALSCGIRAVGVAWGMHSDKQLLAAGAETVAIWPQELTSWLLGGRRESAPATACACTIEPAPVVAATDDKVAAAAGLRRRRALQVRAGAATDAAPEPATGQAPRIDPALLAAIRRIVPSPA